MKLSILITTLPVRSEKLQFLINSIKKQIKGRKVEIIYLGDDKTKSVGAKRNDLLSISRGEYITFVDDDDMVSNEYLDEIFRAMESKPDVIAFHVQRFLNGEKQKVMIYDNVTLRPRMAPNATHYKLCCNHLCVWRKSIIKVRFPDKSLGEDHDWAMDMINHYKTFHTIDKVLYNYYYSTTESETHRRR